MSLNRIFTFCYVAAALCVVLTSFARPIYNWDLVGYTGSVLFFETQDPAVLHKKTFDLLEGSVEPRVFSDLASAGSAYRESVSSNYRSFMQQLPFYNVKILYNLLLYLIGLTGISLVTATLIVSTFSYLVIVFVIYCWVNPMVYSTVAASWWSNKKIALVGILLVASPPFFEVARLSTPDAFSSALFLTGIAYLFSKPKMAAILFYLSVLARPDKIILASLLFLYMGFFSEKRLQIRDVAFFFFATIFSYLAVQWAGRAHPWPVLMHHSFVGLLAFPGDGGFVFGFSEYLSVLWSGMATFWKCSFLIFAGAGGLGCYWLAFDRKNPWVALTLLSLFGTVVHYILFPKLADRFLVTEYVIFTVTFLKALSTRARSG